MTLKRNWLMLGVGVLSALGVLGVRYVLADGIPIASPLYYAGTLAENGQLVDGTRSVTVRLWPDATMVGSPLCTTTAAASVAGGRFRIPLDDSCKTVINQNRSTDVQVVVGTTSFGPTPIGAVPYAVEADHATSATSATNAVDGGGIASSIAELAALTHAPSGFQATLGADESILANNQTTIVFDQVNFDLSLGADGGAEYDPATGRFTPASDGVYFLDCGVSFAWPVSLTLSDLVTPGVTPGESAVQIVVDDNTNELLSNEVTTTGVVSRPHLSGVVKLFAGHPVWCTTYQSTLTFQSLFTADHRTSFSAARLY